MRRKRDRPEGRLTRPGDSTMRPDALQSRPIFWSLRPNGRCLKQRSWNRKPAHSNSSWHGFHSMLGHSLLLQVNKSNQGDSSLCRQCRQQQRTHQLSKSGSCTTNKELKCNQGKLSWSKQPEIRRQSSRGCKNRPRYWSSELYSQGSMPGKQFQKI